MGALELIELAIYIGKVGLVTHIGITCTMGRSSMYTYKLFTTQVAVQSSTQNTEAGVMQNAKPRWFMFIKPIRNLIAHIRAFVSLVWLTPPVHTYWMSLPSYS